MTKFLLMILAVLLITFIYRTVTSNKSATKEKKPYRYTKFDIVLEITIVLIFGAIVLQFIINGMPLFQILMYSTFFILFTFLTTMKIIKTRLS